MTSRGVPQRIQPRKMSASALIRDLLTAEQRELLVLLAVIGLDYADNAAHDPELVELKRILDQSWKGTGDDGG